MNWIDRNYKATQRRGLITESTSNQEFIDKIQEEVNELDLAFLNQDNFNIEEEMADIIITVANFAKHLGIDIMQAIEKKTIFNENRK